MLEQELNLPRTPNRMECYDISNISGSNKVCSMVVFKNGQPSKKDYRKFKIKTVKAAADTIISTATKPVLKSSPVSKFVMTVQSVER